jgi:hypothetical protein
MTYSFRNGFRTAKDRRLFERVPEFELCRSEPGSTISVLPANAALGSATLPDTTIYILQGCGYSGLPDALAAALVWRQHLVVACAGNGLPIDIGSLNEDKLEPHQFPTWSIPDEILTRAGLHRDDRVLVDRIGLMIYEAQTETKFIFPDWPESVAACSLDRINESISTIRQNPAHLQPWSEQLSLAYRLVHASLMANDPEARLILMVTAIEAVLPDRKNRSSEIIGLLDSMIADVRKHPGIGDEVKTNVVSLLHEDKNESISRLGRQLAAKLPNEYDGQSGEQYFRHVYGLRSRLVHGHLDRLSADERDVIDEYKTLLQFVLDVLELSHGPQYS